MIVTTTVPPRRPRKYINAVVVNNDANTLCVLMTFLCIYNVALSL